MDAPDMDGIVYIKINKNLKIGEFVKCKITNIYGEYDLI